MKITLIRNLCCGLALGVHATNGKPDKNLCDWVGDGGYGNLCEDEVPPLPEEPDNHECAEIEITRDGWYGENGWICDEAVDWWDVPELMHDRMAYQLQRTDYPIPPSP